eukprot:6853732-Prymnesium_polylepis.1
MGEEIYYVPVATVLGICIGRYTSAAGYLHWQARACMCTVGQWLRATRGGGTPTCQCRGVVRSVCPSCSPVGVPLRPSLATGAEVRHQLEL